MASRAKEFIRVKRSAKREPSPERKAREAAFAAEVEKLRKSAEGNIGDYAFKTIRQAPAYGGTSSTAQWEVRPSSAQDEAILAIQRAEFERRLREKLAAASTASYDYYPEYSYDHMHPYHHSHDYTYEMPYRRSRHY